MSELNPNHPVTQALRDNWHKVAAVMMHKLGEETLVLTAQDFDALGVGKSIVAFARDDGLHIMLMDNAAAHDLAARHGGLPS